MEANAGEYIRKYLHLKRFHRIMLHCKLVPVQYREYEYGLLMVNKTPAFVILVKWYPQESKRKLIKPNFLYFSIILLDSNSKLRSSNHCKIENHKGDNDKKPKHYCGVG